MWVLSLLLCFSSFLLAQEYPVAPCMTSSSTTLPPCKLEYKPWGTPQIPPDRTVYKTIVTKVMNIVQCDSCSPTVPDSWMPPTASGPWTGVVTSETYTITQVGCMTQTSSIVRREFRGYPELSHPELRAEREPDDSLNSFVGRAVETQLSAEALQTIAAAVAMHIDPDNTQLSEAVYQDLASLLGAQLGIEICISGIDLHDACVQMRTPTAQLQLQDAGLNAKQVGDIVCYADTFGLVFSMSIMELLNQIEAAIYALQVGQNFTTNLAQLCGYMDLSFAGYLGVDPEKIKRDACGGVNTTNTNSTTTAPMTITNSMLSTGLGTAGANGSTMSTEPGPWANKTMSPPLWTGTAGTAGTGGIWQTGQGGPWTNSSGGAATGTDTGASGTGTSGSFPTDTGSGSESGTEGSPGSGEGSGNETSSQSVGENTSASGSGGNGNAWGTGWTSGTGWGGNSTGSHATGTGKWNGSAVGTGVPYGTGWSSNESWSGYPTGTGYNYTTVLSNVTREISPPGGPLTPTLAIDYPEFLTSTTTSAALWRY